MSFFGYYFRLTESIWDSQRHIPSYVQGSAVAIQQLEQWIQDQGIPFAILQAPGNFEQKRLDWGIKSLPWMVLTDADHFVLREGLTLEAIKKRQEQE